MINRQRVARSFHRGAACYDDLTPVQQHLTLEMVERLRLMVQPGDHLLDIGCGTGRLLQLIRTAVPTVACYGLDLAPNMIEQARKQLGGDVTLMVGDAEQLPYADASMDVVVSTSTLQWLDQLSPCFSEVARVLKPGGRFLFSLFAQGTLQDVKQTWRSACSAMGVERTQDHDGTHRFHTPETVQRSLQGADFCDTTVTRSTQTVWYPDLIQLLTAVKQIGANTSRPMSGKGLGWRCVFEEMAKQYQEQFGTEQGVPAQYVTVWGEGRKPVA